MVNGEGKDVSYELFLRINKNLALKLPLHKNRILAAKWIRRIDGMVDLTNYEKTKYLKLLTISMQSKVLVGPFMFEPAPDNFEIMSLYNLKPADIKSMVVDYKYSQRLIPHPYFSEISGDQKEYLVYQEIPDFGSHFYYACSKEPITCWIKPKNTIITSGVIESPILVPPLPEISKTKEEYICEYEAYLQSLKLKTCCKNVKKTKKCRSTTSSECCRRKPKKNKSVVSGRLDLPSDYVDYELIGHVENVAKPQPLHRPMNQTGKEVPDQTSVYFGDDLEPCHCQTANKCQKNSKPLSQSKKQEKIKKLACEYLWSGVAHNERDAVHKAEDYLVRTGCI